MATFSTDLITNLARRPLVIPDGAGCIAAQQATVSVPNTHAANDIIKLGVLPAGCAIVDFKLVSAELDTNASDTLAYDCGVLNSTADGLVTNTKLISAGKMEVAKVQGINTAEGMANIGVSTSDRTIAIKITNVAATKAAGAVSSILTYRNASYGA